MFVRQFGPPGAQLNVVHAGVWDRDCCRAELEDNLEVCFYPRSPIVVPPKLEAPTARPFGATRLDERYQSDMTR